MRPGKLTNRDQQGDEIVPNQNSGQRGADNKYEAWRKVEQSKIHARVEAIRWMVALATILIIALAIVFFYKEKEIPGFSNALTFVLGALAGLLGADYMGGKQVRDLKIGPPKNDDHTTKTEGAGPPTAPQTTKTGSSEPANPSG